MQHCAFISSMKFSQTALVLSHLICVVVYTTMEVKLKGQIVVVYPDVSQSEPAGKNSAQSHFLVQCCDLHCKMIGRIF